MFIIYRTGSGKHGSLALNAARCDAMNHCNGCKRSKGLVRSYFKSKRASCMGVKVAPTFTEYSTAVTLCRHLLQTEPFVWLISSLSS